MRWFSFILLLTSSLFGQSQSLIESFEQYNISRIKESKTLDSLRKKGLLREMKIGRKEIKKSKQGAITELKREVHIIDSIFKEYKKISGFDFDSSSSVLIIYQNNVETNLTTYFIVAQKDTLVFEEKWNRVNLHTYKKEIDLEKGVKYGFAKEKSMMTEINKICLLAFKKEFELLKKITSENSVFDGSTTTIYLAERQTNKYVFYYCFLNPFYLPD